MTVETAQALSLTKTVAASPAEAFEAWTTPEHMKNWSCPDPTADVDIEVDFRVGGSFTIRMDIEGGPFTAYGTYKEIDAPNRLVYTWDWKEETHRMGVDTLVTVEFVEVDGGTEIRLTHEGFPAAEAKVAHGEGWSACLVRYGEVVA